MMFFQTFSWGLRFFVCGALLLAQSQIASADLLWLVGQEQPVPGIVLEENEESVQFRYTAEGVEKRVDVDRKQIRELVITLDQKRLSSLSPQNVTLYLDYAEELAGFSSDSYAIATARQMALIAARLSTGTQRSSAFRLLISLCEGEDRQNVERLAYLYDPTTTLRENSKPEMETIDQEADETLLEIVRMIRRGRASDASELLKQDRISTVVEPLLKVHKDTCNLGELRVAANAATLNMTQLAKLLQLENALTNDAVLAAASADDESWFEASSKVIESNKILPEFENVLEIDPRLSIFRNGTWVAPNVDR